MTKQKWIVHENLIASKLQSRLDTHYYGDCEHLEIQMTTDMILSEARLGSVSALLSMPVAFTPNRFGSEFQYEREERTRMTAFFNCHMMIFVMWGI